MSCVLCTFFWGGGDKWEFAKDKYKAKLRSGEMGFINLPHAKQGGQKYEEVWNKVYLIIVFDCLIYKHLRNMVYEDCITLHIDRTVYHFMTSKSLYIVGLVSNSHKPKFVRILLFSIF